MDSEQPETSEETRDPDSSGGRLPVSRRSVLAGLGGTGVLGGGLVAALGPFQRRYASEPPSIPAERATAVGLDPDPTVQKRTGQFSQDLLVTSLEAELIGYSHEYDYRGYRTRGDSRSAGTATQSTRTGTDDVDDPSGSSPTETNPTDEADDRSVPAPETSADGTTSPADSPDESPAEGPADSASGLAAGTLRILTTPNPQFVGLRLNPAATKSLEALIRTETELFETVCGCQLADADQVAVRSTPTPTDVTFGRADVGRTVYRLDSTDRPATVEFLGEPRDIGYFLLGTAGRDGRVRAHVVLVAKATRQLGTGTPEAVIASYHTTRTVPSPADRSLRVVADPSADTRGLFTRPQLSVAAERFRSVLPAFQDRASTPTATPSGVAWTSGVDRRGGPVRSTSLLAGGPFQTVQFGSDLGRIEVLVPDDISQGDPIFATVRVQPAGQTETDRSDNSGRLAAHDLRVGETVVSLPTRRVSTRVATDTDGLEVALQRDGADVTSQTIPVLPYEAEYPFVPGIDQDPTALARRIDDAATTPDYQLLTLGTTPGPIAVWGLFDTDPETTTISIDGTDLPLLAETPRRAIARVPATATGAVTLTLTERQQTVTRGLAFGDGASGASAQRISRLDDESGRLGPKLSFGPGSGPARPVPQVRSRDPEWETPEYSSEKIELGRPRRFRNGARMETANVDPVKVDKLQQALVDHWKRAWKQHWSAQVVYGNVARAVQSEAQTVAKRIIQFNRTRYNLGWRGGWINNVEVGLDRLTGMYTGDGPPIEGMCRDWAREGVDAVELEHQEFFRPRRLVNENRLREGEGIRLTHFALGIEPILPNFDPEAGGIQHTLLYDPWRNDGLPFWVPVPDDQGWDWAFWTVKIGADADTPTPNGSNQSGGS